MRLIQDISHSWKFWLEKEMGEGVEVDLPHVLSLTPANSSGGRNFQGLCIYKKRIMISKAKKNKHIMIEFAGAMGVTKLYINGSLVYTHYCSYLPLRVDISNWVIFGVENEIRLVLDNSDCEDVPPGKPQDDLDFTYDGGLYRSARLIIKEKLYITDELIEDEVAGGGCFLSSNLMEDLQAMVQAKIHVRNEMETRQKFQLCVSMFYQEILMGSTQKTYFLEGKTAKHFIQEIVLENPILWDVKSPNLYQVEVELCRNGKPIDYINLNFGIREFYFTFDQNLIFNKKSIRLSGANYHPTYPYVGYAISDNLLRRDARKLKKLGMENVRSHYPLADAFVEECNQLGMTVIVSNPGWQWYKEGIFTEKLIQNMRKIIRWQRNYSCVILWEPIPNESVVPQNIQLLLHNLVHEEYPFKVCYTASDHGPTDVSYRMYDPGMLEPGMEGYDPAKRYGEKDDYPVWIREYNDAPDNWVDQNCAWRTPRAWGDYAQLRAVERMLGQDSQCIGNNYIDVYCNKMICGYGVWPAIEHNRGYHINPCWGGFLDLFRIPKMTAYFIESQKEPEEAGYVLHIANWWTDISPVDVTVFSNAERVRLFHDDILVGEQQSEDIDVKHPPFIFKDVHNKFKGRNRSTLRADAMYGGKVIASEEVKSPGVPFQLLLSVDTENVPIKTMGDLFVVHCVVTDRDGTVVPYAADNHPIFFEVDGGEIIGNATNGANPICPQAGITSILVKTRGYETIEIRARLFWVQKNERVAIRPTKIIIQC